MTWEPTENLSEDLIRDFEECFWQACKAADMQVLGPALQYGGETMANIVDAERRSPLHFAAALNQQHLVTALLDAGVPPLLLPRLPCNASSTQCCAFIGSHGIFLK
jgi:signal recognition particle 43 kDa protein